MSEQGDRTPPPGGAPPTSGEERLHRALARRRARARDEDPRPYDEAWGWWIEQRLRRLEAGQKWLLGLALSTLAAELVRIALAALGAAP